VRQFGTNNLPDCSNMCHESSGLALKEVIGVGKGTVKLEDFDFADTMLIVGQNPGTNHPHMLSSLRARRGAPIISVIPLAEVGLVRFKHPQDVLHSRPGTKIAKHFVQVPDSFLDRLRDVFGFEPPRKHGWDVVESIKAMHRGDAKVFFAMGGNFLSATPDTDFTAEALSRCNLTVHVSTKLNRAHVITGKQALILPCLGRTDRDLQAGGPQFVSVENSMGVVHASRGNLEPPSEQLLSEPAIVARLAVATLGSRTTVNRMRLVEDYDRIRD
jgi:anaerobic selenocysteine-containing dehydrogenase